jgi:hypothetical protein
MMSSPDVAEPLFPEEPPVEAEILPEDDRAGETSAGSPISYREILAVLALVVVSDLTLYRGQGFAGYGAFFLAAPLLLLFGAPRARFGKGSFLVGLMLVLLAAKLAWNGSMLAVASGFALVVAFAMVLAGLCPYVLETVVYASQTILAGYEGLRQYRRSSTRLNPAITRSAWLNYGLPVAAFVAFGLLFIVANPDLLRSFGETFERVLNSLRDWILEFSPEWQEMLFWVAVSWIAVGMLRPVVTRSLLGERASLPAMPAGAEPVRALFYVPFRNTLVTVIVLFAVYLGFEFKTLWFRVFPPGFYYSGYAHEGAAWLTVALALATLVLSLIFRGSVLGDPRLPRLRRMAWVWSLENLLLAAAVYHRLLIYIGFNGMTWMRTVGFFGMSCVVAGFLLVVWKIVRNRDFVWLVRHHLWALALAVYLFALTPVDALVHRYNVRRILRGDPAPSVQISVHPIDLAAVPVLLPLADCRDPIIREGVRAMLADRLDEAEARAREHQTKGWTAWQLSDRYVLDRLRAESGKWAEYQDRAKREAALERFHEYAYKWF